MQSNLTLHIVEPGSSTPVVPDTGLFTSGIGGPEATILGITAAVIILAVIVAVLYYRNKKQGKFISLKHKKATTIGLASLAAVVSLGTVAGLLKLGANAIDAEADETIAPVVSSDELTIELGNEPVFAVLPVDITVEQATEAGYILTAFAESTDLVSTTDSSKVIPMIAVDEGELAVLTDNTYGLALAEPASQAEEVYTALSTDADNPTLLVEKEEATEENDKTTIYYGFYITPDTPYGTYTSGDVYYDVEKNRTDLATVIFDGNGLTFGGNNTNATKYIVNTELGDTAYSHTPNVNNEGEQDGMYAYGLNATSVYQFANGATNVHVKIVKSGNDSSCGPDGSDYFTFWKGSKPTYTAIDNYETAEREFGNSNGKYEFGSYNNVETNLENVDAVTFAYTTNSYSQYYCQEPGYGYYAEITAQDKDGNNVNLIGNKMYKGSYLVPSTDTGYRFLGWSTEKNATAPTYYTEQEVALGLKLTVGGEATVYAVWKPAFVISYDGNGADSTTSMDKVVEYTTNVESTSQVDLLASNYTREGYGFAGWSTDADAWDHLTNNDESDNPTIYGPNQTITVNPTTSTKLNLYAVWVPVARNNGEPVELQNWQGCSSLTPTTYNNGVLTVGKNTVTALKDSRDDTVYAVARLADGNCWMVENLRLDSDATIATTNTHNPVVVSDKVAIMNNDGNTSNHLSPTTNTWCQNSDTDCYDQSYLNTNNVADAATNPTANVDFTTSPHAINLGGNIYSYGNVYNWYSATAGNGTYSTGYDEEHETSIYEDAAGDICPTGWQLPYGGDGNGSEGHSKGNTKGGFYYLNQQMGKGTSDIDSNNWRSFPNNFVYSGYWNGSSAGNRGNGGYYWSSTAYGTSIAYNLLLVSGNVGPGRNYDKSYGYSVRCLAPSE